MLDTAHQETLEESAVAMRRPLGGVGFGITAGSAVLVAAMLLGGAALWIHYGTAIFFEMIASGIASCVG
jgi:hypothetical protein